MLYVNFLYDDPLFINLLSLIWSSRTIGFIIRQTSFSVDASTKFNQNSSRNFGGGTWNGHKDMTSP
jgi:hypothetical protein